MKRRYCLTPIYFYDVHLIFLNGGGAVLNPFDSFMMEQEKDEQLSSSLNLFDTAINNRGPAQAE